MSQPVAEATAAARLDLFAILDAVPEGYGALRLAIMEGRIDPKWSDVGKDTKRGCIKAHLAAHLGCSSRELPGAACCPIWVTGEPNPISPVECWLYGVQYGDRPATSPVLRQLVGWLDEWKGRSLELESDYEAF